MFQEDRCDLGLDQILVPTILLQSQLLLLVLPRTLILNLSLNQNQILSLPLHDFDVLTSSSLSCLSSSTACVLICC
jgi:hypothetical protein